MAEDPRDLFTSESVFTLGNHSVDKLIPEEDLSFLKMYYQISWPRLSQPLRLCLVPLLHWVWKQTPIHSTEHKLRVVGSRGEAPRMVEGSLLPSKASLLPGLLGA